MTTIGFIGFGLIGASIAKSLKSKVPGKYSVVVYDYHTDENPVLNKALNEGVIVSITKTLYGLCDCDIIFLCAPTLKNISYLEKLKGTFQSLKTPLPLITDVGSVKGNIVKAAEELGLGANFIGGHPMAGSEKTGYDNANDHLLENSYYILTPAEGSTEKQLDCLKELVADTGAISIILESKEHDRITAAISHVPHIIAAELVNLVQDAGEDTPKMKMLAAGGFKDITRIASSSPEMWKSILLSNPEAILQTLDSFQDSIVRIEAAIISGNGDYIDKSFRRAGEFRNSIPNAKGLLNPSYYFYMDIEDRAGAIASVANDLYKINVSIKNIGIINNRSYDQGVLRVEMYDKESMEKAIRHLKEIGYTVIEAE
ncbi:MAG: prephenate dehydrogenase/arogenate dehydrogenase family protein [Lachnospiraceae bacterium]